MRNRDNYIFINHFWLNRNNGAVMSYDFFKLKV